MDVNHLVATYGYWAVLIAVAIGCCIPFPGAAILTAAAVYAGTTHELNIAGVILAAAAGGILGNLLGYRLGSSGGQKLLQRYGHIVHLDESRIYFSQYLFERYGGRAVFFGRFMGPVRSFAGFLAGVNRMRWGTFVLFSVAGGIVWAVVWGMAGYLLGDNDHSVTLPGGSITYVLLAVGAFIFLRRLLKRLHADAEAARRGKSIEVPPETPQS